LKGAIKKYGRDAFEVSVLASGLDDDQAALVEKEMIRVYETKAPLGYNLTEGGQGSPHKNPDHGKNIAKAWQRPETRQKHMAWRTTERLSEMANSDEQWRRQQMAWMDKRLSEALRLPTLLGARLVWYRASKCRERAIKVGRTEEQLQWMDQVRDEHIKEIWAVSGEPAPPASSWVIKNHTFQKRLKAECSRLLAITKFRPSVICSGEGASEDRSWMIPSDPED
jgi:hypothetical protein